MEETVLESRASAPPRFTRILNRDLNYQPRSWTSNRNLVEVTICPKVYTEETIMKMSDAMTFYENRPKSYWYIDSNFTENTICPKVHIEESVLNAAPCYARILNRDLNNQPRSWTLNRNFPDVIICPKVYIEETEWKSQKQLHFTKIV